MNPVLSSGVTGVRGGGEAGGRVPAETVDREIFTELPGKKRQGKKGKGVKIGMKKNCKIVKGKGQH